MKALSFVVSALLVCSASFGQLQPTEPDKSPMDMSYCPNGYPILKFQVKSKPPKLNARVIYSRPQKKGRDIFGGEVRYNEIWRLGANESTEIELFTNATVGGKKINKGRYSMMAIPTATDWTIIINKETDNWGSFSYKALQDVLRVQAPVQKLDAPVEYFTMYFDNNNNLVMMWDQTKVSLPFQFSNK